MIEAMIAKRYARALLDLAQQQGPKQVDLYGQQIQAFCQTCRTNPVLLTTLANSHFDLFARERIVTQVAKKLELSEHVLNFLKLMVHKGRASLFNFVSDEYTRLANALLGRTELTVVSAVELPEATLKQLVEHFHRESGHEILLRKKTDSRLLGGIRVHLGDKVYDYTLQGQLEQLKQQLAA